MLLHLGDTFHRAAFSVWICHMVENVLWFNFYDEQCPPETMSCGGISESEWALSLPSIRKWLRRPTVQWELPLGVVRWHHAVDLSTTTSVFFFTEHKRVPCLGTRDAVQWQSTCLACDRPCILSQHHQKRKKFHAFFSHAWSTVETRSKYVPLAVI
jgi:hypothetical protein